MDNLRRFVVVFTYMVFVTLVVLGFYLALNFNTVADGLTKEISVEENRIEMERDVKEEENICENILFVVGDLDKDDELFLFIINVNTKDSTMSFMFIPRDIEFIAKNEENKSLYISKISEVCRKDSLEKCASTISSILDISIPYYLHMNFDTFVKFFNVFSSVEGGFMYNVPVSFSYNREGVYCSFAKGEKKFSGIDVLNFIRFYKTDDNTYSSELLEYYDGSDSARLKVFKSLVSEFMNSQFIMQKDDYYSKNFQALFSGSILKNVTTNINTDNLKLIPEYLSSLKKSSICYYLVDGTEHINGEYYVQFNDSVIDLSEAEKYASVPSDEIIKTRFQSNK